MPKAPSGRPMSLIIVPNEKSEKTNKSGVVFNQMSKFAAYIKEREGVDLIETEWGFAIYVIQKQECYIRDVFVYPEHRRSRECYGIADQIVAIAKEAGCTLLTGSVSPGTNNATASIEVLIGYGMKLHSSLNNLIFFSKDI